MTSPPADARLTARLVEALYTDALLLADETRGYFDEAGRADREALPPAERVVFACEALKGTTRLMQAIAWLLMRRAIAAGELVPGDPRAAERRLGEAPPLEADALAGLPGAARRLLLAGADLYERVRRAEETIEQPAVVPSPARSLLARLERAF